MRWVFTFGVGHGLAGHYVRSPEGMDFMQARMWMIEKFGTAWCAQYESPEEAGAEKYGLVEFMVKEG